MLMFKIIKKEQLNPLVTLMEICAPLIAKKALPGQFIIFRLDEQGERIPLTIADYDREKGTVTIIFQAVGLSTKLLAEKKEGEYIQDFVGPLGRPTELNGYKKAVVIGGGVGCAIAYPQAKWLSQNGAQVDIIAGFRSKEIVILQQQMNHVASHCYIMTDDGSYGEQGFVTNKLQQLLEEGNQYDVAIAIGPIPMMKAVSELTLPSHLKTIVSLNPIMIDGTGMCGGCRVTVGGQTKFACVDGPEFDGHQVDYSELMKRNSFYKEQEQQSFHNCRLRNLL